MNDLVDEVYARAVMEILTKGTRKENRTGVDTISTFNINYELNLERGFPLLTSKRISWKNIVIENLWFLSGQQDISILRKHGCKFWDAWADKDGKVPSAYGNFWRNFPVPGHLPDDVFYGRFVSNDQIKWVLGELQRNPMSRRMLVSAWAPGNAQTSKLPPCHAMFVLNVQNTVEGYRTLNLHLTQRSCDIALGVPYNIAGYAFILSLFARFAGLQPGIFAHTLIDAHAYTAKPDGSMSEFDHVPSLLTQIRREPRQMPNLLISPHIQSLSDVEQLLECDTEEVMSHFLLAGYSPNEKVDFKVAV